MITDLAVIELGELLKLLLSNSNYRKYGWTRKAIATANMLKKESPQLQFKAKLKVRNMLADYPDSYQVLYHKP